MTSSPAKRYAAGIAAALSLGIAAPVASARPFDIAPSGSYVPARTSALSAPQTPSPANGDISDWAYVAIGAGVTSFALISAGGARAARRRQRAAAQARIAA